MGACTSSNAEGGNNPSKGQKDTDVHITIIGAHQVGKTTIARQLLFAHGATMSDMERQHLLSVIHNNIIQTIQVLCTEAHNYGSLSIDAEDAFQYFINKSTDVLDDVVVSYVRKLWNEPAIQTTFENRHNFYLRNPDNIQYFLDKITEVARNDYIPSDEDVIRLSMRTTAFNHSSFTQANVNVHLHDLGGLRSERPRWPNKLTGQTACIFVVSLADYDQKLHEDRTTNRLAESLQLFSDLARNGYFLNTPIILVFTHFDIFTEKIAARNISSSFSDYSGPSHDVEAAREWICGKFTAQKNPGGEPIQLTSLTINALDTDQAKKCLATLAPIKPVGGKEPKEAKEPKD